MKLKEVLDNPEFQKEYRRTKPAVRAAALAVGNVVAQMMKDQHQQRPFPKQAMIGALTFTELRSLVGRTVASYLQYPDQLGFVDFAHIISEYNGLHVFHGSTAKDAVLWFMEESRIVPTIDLQLADVKRLYAAIHDDTVNLDLGTHDQIDREPKSNSPLIDLTVSTLNVTLTQDALILLRGIVALNKPNVTRSDLGDLLYTKGKSVDLSKAYAFKGEPEALYAAMDNMLPRVVDGYKVERVRTQQKSKGSAVPTYTVTRVKMQLTEDQLTMLMHCAMSLPTGSPFTAIEMLRRCGIDTKWTYREHESFARFASSLVVNGYQIVPVDSALFRSSGVVLQAKANKHHGLIAIPKPSGPRLTHAQVSWLVDAAYATPTPTIVLRTLLDALLVVSSPIEATELDKVTSDTATSQFEDAIRFECRGDLAKIIVKRKGAYVIEQDDEDEEADDDGDYDDAEDDDREAPSKGKSPKPAPKTAKPEKGSKRPKVSSLDDDEDEW